MKHSLNPAAPLTAQLRAIGFVEPHPLDRVVLYRFFGADGCLLYVGVTWRPFDRWQQHKNTAEWWPLVACVAVEWHPDENAALAAEVAAIKTENPRHNVRSAPRVLMHGAAIPHTLLMRNVALSRSGSRRERWSRDEVPIHRRLGERAGAMDGRFAAELFGGRP